jgi:flagellar motor switch protein FliM
MHHAWENVVDLKLSVERVESNPQLVQIVPPNEVVVLISFELTLGEMRGMMNLCIPFNSIERISGKLSSDSWFSYGKTESTEETMRGIAQRLHGSLVEMAVQLAKTQISTNDLVGLRVGDIITTEKDVHAPLSVRVEGVDKFVASVGAFKGRKAIRIENVLVTGKSGAHTAGASTAGAAAATASAAPAKTSAPPPAQPAAKSGAK